MKRRRHKRRRNPIFVCKKMGKKLFGGGRRRKARKSAKRRRKMTAGFKKSGALMKRVWAKGSKTRAALMRMSPKARFKAAWKFARKMR